ncbi:phage tail sheath C-terminal domain-containing protein [Ferruginibacter sp.]|uniref:phage tail sheath family protein n=1 Tax=Ferruginibacter sp. TaxID=1940288 RepID=UPI001998D10D|nr:phage tail sheath C-terminal domain-containing protein [Ferruginibacter sp.]MBC7627334.1 phage tail sheath family protein [Ferruginibacter sp.]
MPEYKHPGVYIEEIPHLPPSIASAETAIPCFIGYTEKAQWKKPADLHNKPWRIESMLEYEQYFGNPDSEKTSLSVILTAVNNITTVTAAVEETKRSKFLMNYSLQMFFANGGGPCWIVSVGDYASNGGAVAMKDLSGDDTLGTGGLIEAAKVNEITLLIFPDSTNIDNAVDYYTLHDKAITQCVKLQDRFVILDVYHTAANAEVWLKDIKDDPNSLRDLLAPPNASDLKYAAAYFPKVYTGLDFYYQAGVPSVDNDATIPVTGGAADVKTLADLKSKNNAQYFQAKSAIINLEMLMPVAATMAGIFAQVDNARGVWKAPANVNILGAIRPQYLINNTEQDDLNVDPVAGKSVNIIRSFQGRGPAIVWGARTLAGNDNEWRYISVRRFFIMVEESVNNATQQFVFEPNDENTWVRIKSMIQNYLTERWKEGALMGASVKEAFFVHVGLNLTMSEQDILEGRLIIQVGLAVVRPAEFIILRFMHKLLSES